MRLKLHMFERYLSQANEKTPVEGVFSIGLVYPLGAVRCGVPRNESSDHDDCNECGNHETNLILYAPDQSDALAFIDTWVAAFSCDM